MYRIATLGKIDSPLRQPHNAVRQLETVRTMGDENDGPVVQGIVAVFDE